jgi:hypothetical protein
MMSWHWSVHVGFLLDLSFTQKQRERAEEADDMKHVTIRISNALPPVRI